MKKKLRAVCGACGKVLSINPKHAGRNGRCPSCGGKIQIPKLPEEELDFPVSAQPEGFVDDIELLEEPGPDGAPADIGEGTAGPHGRLPNPLVPDREEEPTPPVTVQQAQADPFLGEPVVEIAAIGEPAGLVDVALIPVGDEPQETPDSKLPAGKAAWLKPALAVAGMCVAALGIVIFINARHKPAAPAVGSLSQPASQQAQGVGQATPTPPVAPAAAGSGWESSVGSCRIAACSFSIFAPGGQLPAGADSLYCTVQANISAAGQEMRLDLAKDILLSVDGTDVACLGLPADGGDGLRRAKRAVVAIPAKGEQTLTLVFEVPASARAGKLKVKGLPEVAVILGRPEAPPGDAELAGTWAEISPRAIKPLLKDPVCAAIQETPPQDQRIIVSLAKNVFSVRMPSAGVSGVASKVPQSDGLFDTELAGPGATLKCKLRLAPGPRLVLYLQDEPFHQLVLGKVGAPSTQAANLK